MIKALDDATAYVWTWTCLKQYFGQRYLWRGKDTYWVYWGIQRSNMFIYVAILPNRKVCQMEFSSMSGRTFLKKKKKNCPSKDAEICWCVKAIASSVVWSVVKAMDHLLPGAPQSPPSTVYLKKNDFDASVFSQNEKRRDEMKLQHLHKTFLMSTCSEYNVIGSTVVEWYRFSLPTRLKAELHPFSSQRAVNFSRSEIKWKTKRRPITACHQNMQIVCCLSRCPQT